MLSGIGAIVTGVVLLLVLMATGMPVFVAFMLINLLAVGLIIGPAGYGMFVNSLYDTATTGSLVTVPLFILMGEILFRSNSVDVLLHAIDRLVGRVRGRQYVLTVLLSAVFSTLSGAAMGVAAMMGRSLLPVMISRGYDPRLSVGNIIAGASLAPLIPPSVLTIIIGTLAGVSISGLLIAGIVPGLILGAMFIGYTFTRIALDPSLAPSEPETRAPLGLREAALAVANLLPFSIIIVMVMGLILMGVATPTEAGAMGVIGALVAAAIYRRLTLGMIARSLAATALISAMILMIMASSKLFSQLLAFTGGATALTEFVVSLDFGYWGMLAVLLLLPFVFCMFIDQIALMLIVIPIYIPIIAHFGYDPIWFWLLFLINITVGGMTPPFGYTLFALKGAWDGGSLMTVFSAAWPFVVVYVLGIVVFAVAPRLVTFLPGLL